MNFILNDDPIHWTLNYAENKNGVDHSRLVKRFQNKVKIKKVENR